MATDVTTLGIRIDIEQVKKAITSLENLAKAADNAEKQVKEIGDAAKAGSKATIDANDKAVASFSKAVKAMKALEDAQLKAAKSEVERAKAARISQQQLDSALSAKVNRENAYAAAIDRSARLAEESSKRQAALSSREAANLALKQKYADQGNAALQKTAAYAVNQQSLVENRTLSTQARIEQGAQRLALQQEKFEYQKQRAAERAAKSTQTTWKDVLSTLSDFTVAGYGVGQAGGFLVQVAKTADNLTLLDSRLKLSTKSQADFKQAQDALYSSSIKNGLNLETQIDTYTQTERATRAMGLSVGQLSFLTESFGKAAVVSGASTESYKSALTQLNQGFASGVIRGQEFNSVAEQAPAILEALANGLRGNNKEFDALEKKGLLGVAALRKMAGEGKLVNGTTIPALMKGLQETNAQFEKMPMTIGRATESLGASYKKWLNDQNTATGATQTLANGIVALGNNFDSISKIATFTGVALVSAFGGKVVSAFTEAAKASSLFKLATVGGTEAQLLALKTTVQSTEATVLNTKAELDNARAKTASGVVTRELIALEIAHQRALVTSAEANVAYSVAAGKAATATTAFGTALSLAGGWVGVVATALIAIVAYWDDIDKAINRAIKSKKYFMGLSDADINKAPNQILSEANAELAKVEAEIKALNQQKSAMASNYQYAQAYTGQAAGDAANKAFDAQMKELNDRKYAALAAKKRAEDAVEEARVELKKSEIATYSVSSAPLGGTPTPDKPKVSFPLLGAGESELIKSRSVVQALQDELNLTEALGTSTDNLNQYEKQALELKLKIDALDPAAKKYAEAKANMELQLSEVKKAAVLRKQIDDLQERNKKYNEWVKVTDEAIQKQERLSMFTQIDLTARSSESPLEKQARIVRETYEDTLTVLQEIEKIRNKGEAAGATYGEVQSKVNEFLRTRKPKKETTFADQLDFAQSEIDAATASGDMNAVEEAQKRYTAIVEEQTRQRNLLRQQELDSIKSTFGAMGDATTSIMSVLENAGQKQSGIYKALFFANKAFSIAQSIISIQTGIAQAAALPFPANLGAMATVAASTASIVSTIASTDLSFAKGGVFDGKIGAGGNVVNTQANFTTGSGQTARMAESGAEAIMPLRRDAKGRLGVTVSGGSGGGNVVTQHFNPTVIVQGGNTNEETSAVVSEAMIKAMKAISQDQILQAKRQKIIN